MSDATNALFVEMTNRYLEQRLPWDQELSPPEVVDIVQAMPPGRALDLGCGPGRACVYLAQKGWQCDGVDFIEEAIATARQRAELAGVADRIAFYQASVADIDFLLSPYDLVVDVGCLHAQAADVQLKYAHHVKRLLKLDGLFLLFVHLTNGIETGKRQWITPTQVEKLFLQSFTIERVEYGSTTVSNDTWPSAWYWMRQR